MTEEEKKGSFKVLDRRRFDESGNARAGVPEPKPDKVVPPSEPPRRAASSPPPPPPPSSEDHPMSTDMTFGSFVMSLATQALMQLGEMQPPPGMQMEKDIEAAKQTIDILNLLEVKTRGNLDAAEKQLMDKILTTLRMSFVRASGGK